MSEQSTCAERSLASGEPLAGTAPQVDVWLLVEYAPLWEAKALQANQLPPAASEWMEQAVQKLSAGGWKVRPSFIRRRRNTEQGVTVFIARDGRLEVAKVPTHELLPEIDVSTRHPLVSAPQYFVCTNGRRDRCCARYGLPLYRALIEHVGNRAWEITHVGGHRFAPNVVVLPQGVLYGRVFDEHVRSFVDDVEVGRLAKAFVRGRSAYPPAAQAAELLVPDGAELLAVDDAVATFRSPVGEHRVALTPGTDKYEFIGSCGNDIVEERTPLALRMLS